MKTKNNIIFSFIFTILFLGFVIWNRFIRVRLPKDLNRVSELNIEKSIIIILMILFFSLFIYYFLLLLKVIPNKNSKFTKVLNTITNYLEKFDWFNLLTNFLYTHTVNGPINTYEYFYERIYIRPFLNKLNAFLVYTLEGFISYVYYSVFVCIKLCVAITFVVEILFLKQIIYFYLLLILLLIPLIVKFLMFVATHSAKRAIDYFHYFFVFEVNMENRTAYPRPKELSDPEDIEEQKKFDRVYMVDLWDFYQRVYRINYELQNLIDNRKYLINTIYYGLMSTGFIFYVLILYDKY